MSSLRQYSGLTTKIKAMRSKLLTEGDFIKFIELDTVSEVADYLKNRPGYDRMFDDVDISNVHRETVEYAIKYTVYSDFDKIYKFANLEQRKFLKLQFNLYEMDILKSAIRKSSTEYITREQNDFINGIFARYSGINVNALYEARSMGEIIELLRGTIFYEPLKMVQDLGKTAIVDYELALDTYSFMYVWKKKRVLFDNGSAKALKDRVGTEVDMLNLTWIYRAKKFYRMNQSEIASMIIPIYHRVKKNQLAMILEKNEVSEVIDEIGKTAYGRYLTPEKFGNMELDRVCKKLVKRVYDKYYRTEPYSMAVMSSYLYDKEEETEKLIKIVESIRYGYPKDDIMKEII